MRIIAAALSLAAGTLLSGVVLADSYSDTIDVFRKAGASASYFDRSHGYAVFPTVGKGGLIIGGAHGTGRVYQNGQYVGDTSMTQVSVGLQVGGRPTVRSSSSKTSAPSRNSRPETLSSTPG
jgi:lipid-binding SYLF domain-containing protein